MKIILTYTLMNIIEQDNKYLIVTSLCPIVDIDFRFKRFKIKIKKFLLQNIEKPDDELMFY